MANDDDLKVEPAYKFGLTAESKKCFDEAADKLLLLTQGFADNQYVKNMLGMDIVKDREVHPAPLYVPENKSNVGVNFGPFMYSGNRGLSSSLAPAVGALAASIVKPDFDRCMEGKSPFVPRDPTQYKSPYNWEAPLRGRR